MANDNKTLGLSTCVCNWISRPSSRRSGMRKTRIKWSPFPPRLPRQIRSQIPLADWVRSSDTTKQMLSIIRLVGRKSEGSRFRRNWCHIGRKLIHKDMVKWVDKFQISTARSQKLTFRSLATPQRLKICRPKFHTASSLKESRLCAPIFLRGCPRQHAVNVPYSWIKNPRKQEQKHRIHEQVW